MNVGVGHIARIKGAVLGHISEHTPLIGQLGFNENSTPTLKSSKRRRKVLACGPARIFPSEDASFLQPTQNLRTSRDSFIYEYVGEVVSQPSFMKRMRQYSEEGIRHFYFMMLQKDEVRHFNCWPSSPTLTYRLVHRCNQKGRYRTFCQSQLQPQLLCGKMGDRETCPNGYLCETVDQEA